MPLFILGIDRRGKEYVMYVYQCKINIYPNFGKYTSLLTYKYMYIYIIAMPLHMHVHCSYCGIDLDLAIDTRYPIELQILKFWIFLKYIYKNKNKKK